MYTVAMMRKNDSTTTKATPDPILLRVLMAAATRNEEMEGNKQNKINFEEITSVITIYTLEYVTNTLLLP